MTEEGIDGVVLFCLLILLLIGLGVFLPSNTLTGNTVRDDVESCGTLGCSELCDPAAEENTCGGGTTCCPTQWETGVCDYDCATVLEYSKQMSLAAYQDSVREQPSPVDPGWRFWLPILVVLGIVIYFFFRRKNPHW